MSDPFAAPDSANSFSMPRSRFRLRRIGILSVGLFTGAAGLIVGLFGGFILMMFAGFGLNVAGGPAGQNPSAALGMGVGTLILMPLFYGVMGFIAGVVNGFIYNVLAGMTGGIELEFSEG